MPPSYPPKEITKNKTGQVIPHEGDNYLIVVEVVFFFGLLREKNLVLISYFNTTYFYIINSNVNYYFSIGI
jgi:hypothetical protein